MRALHFDCFSGISGDMTFGALIDLGVDAELIREGIRSLNLPITMKVESIRKGGFQSTKVDFEFPHEHAHRHLHHIEKIINEGQLSQRQRELAMRIFRNLGEAEAEVHGIALEKVHFHEVGALDSIADIVGVSIALDHLKLSAITSRSVPTGNGMVKCEHGMMPIPAPATAKLLQGVPLSATDIQGELTTPTGAAILKTIVQKWNDHPTMTIEKIGCGAGTRDLKEQPNILRVFLGEVTASAETDVVWKLETNLDDVSAEVVGYCFDCLLEAGALDVFAMPIQMKKNRPGTLLTVLCEESQRSEMESILFRETGTFGIRRTSMQRSILKREIATVQTPWGEVRVKKGWRGEETPIVTPEYEDCARIAREQNLSLNEIYSIVRGLVGTNQPIEGS